MSTLDPKTMVRLRDAKQVVHVSGTASAIVDLADLRALLDALSALEAAHTEALDALVGALHVLRESDAADVWQEETDAVKAVLAKAGRR